MNLKKEIGKRIKEARQEANFKQKEVAELLQMVQPSYARYENGTLELDYYKLIFLCKLFNVSADYILGLEDDSTSKYIKNSYNTFSGSNNKISFK